MKKIIINAFLVCAGILAFTSCSKSNKCEENCDSELPKSAVDKASMDRGALDGALLNQYVNGDPESVDHDKLIEYIQGYQLVVGSKMSESKLQGIMDGLAIASEINKFEEMTGSKFNRELYLREFRRFIQKQDLTQSEIDKIYRLVDDDRAGVETFLYKKTASECCNLTDSVECNEIYKVEVDIDNSGENIIIEDIDEVDDLIPTQTVNDLIVAEEFED